MENEVKCEGHTVVWEVSRVLNQRRDHTELHNGQNLLVEMEEASVKSILQKSPNEETQSKKGDNLRGTQAFMR